jgi:hypothetical protein
MSIPGFPNKKVDNLDEFVTQISNLLNADKVIVLTMKRWHPQKNISGKLYGIRDFGSTEIKIFGKQMKTTDPSTIDFRIHVEDIGTKQELKYLLRTIIQQDNIAWKYKLT